MSKSVITTVALELDSFASGGVLDIACNTDQELITGPHIHPHGELFLLHAGHLKARSETGHWFIPPQQICWIPPYSVHGADDSNLEWVRIHIPVDKCSSLPQIPCVWTSTLLARAIFDRFAQKPGLYESITETEQRMFDMLFDDLSVSVSAPILLPMPRHPELRSFADEWLKQIDEMSGLDDIAASSSMSRRTLTRTFRKETGMSIGKWRQVARLMVGIDMLLEGKSVTETAMSLGYDSISSFVILCKRLTGLSPKVLANSICLR